MKYNSPLLPTAAAPGAFNKSNNAKRQPTSAQKQTQSKPKYAVTTPENQKNAYDPYNSSLIIRGDTQLGKENGQSASAKAADRVRSGLTDLKAKMEQMKQKREQANREMQEQLQEYE